MQFCIICILYQRHAKNDQKIAQPSNCRISINNLIDTVLLDNHQSNLLYFIGDKQVMMACLSGGTLCSKRIKTLVNILIVLNVPRGVLLIVVNEKTGPTKEKSSTNTQGGHTREQSIQNLIICNKERELVLYVLLASVFLENMFHYSHLAIFIGSAFSSINIFSYPLHTYILRIVCYQRLLSRIILIKTPCRHLTKISCNNWSSIYTPFPLPDSFIAQTIRKYFGDEIKVSNKSQEHGYQGR